MKASGTEALIPSMQNMHIEKDGFMICGPVIGEVLKATPIDLQP